MPRKQKDLRLGTDDEGIFVIQEFDPDQALYWGARLLHIAGGALDGVGISPLGQVEKTPINLGELMQGIVYKVDPKELPVMVRTVVEQSLVIPAYTPEVYVERFQGNLPILLSLVTEIFEFNYENLAPTLKKTMPQFILPLFASLFPAEKNSR